MAERTAETLLDQGQAAYAGGHRKYARQLYRNALKACKPDEGAWLRAAIHTALAKVQRDLGDVQSSLGHYRTAADIYRNQNSPLQLAHSDRHLADILRELDRADEAESLIAEAIEIYRAQQPPTLLNLANALRVAALSSEQLLRFDRALRLWTEARDLYIQLGVESGAAESQVHVASLTNG